MESVTALSSTLLNDYTLVQGAYDEMWRAQGVIEPTWQPLMQMVATLGQEGLERVQQDARRLLRENGVTYNVHGAPDGLQRPWPMDILPLIISEADWQVIEAGVMQRAKLLDLVLADLYGPRRLLQAGLLPLELVYSHNGFLRPCDGVTLPHAHQLILYAADLARGPDGRMWVLGDRTQAPSGAGYALENRTVMATVMRAMFRSGNIQYLSNFFRDLQAALAELTPQHRDAPHIVVLTPGPYNETYFEHAYLAAYLGYALVQGADLTVQEGKVALKSLAGLQPVDVILRRVDDSFCDPLELREDSYLGVAGLLEVARRQQVAIANPLGASVLENAGLLPFLPGLAKHFFNEELILPAAATWWCGQPRELKYVLEHLDQLVIKPLTRQAYTSTIFGKKLSKRGLAQLRARIKAQPNLFVGQEEVSFSTTPCLVDGQIVARHSVLRTFAVARQDHYTVMPGGLTRSAPDQDTFIVSNSAGGSSKDTWVLSSKPQHHISLWQQAVKIDQVYESERLLASRAAENLFWVGRYAERAENSARLLRIIMDYYSGDELLADAIEMSCLHQLLRALTQVTMSYPGFVDTDSEARLANPTPELLALCLDGNRSGSLLADVRAMVNAAYGVRDFWSGDSWRVIDNIEAPWKRLEARHCGLDDVQKELNNLVTQLMALAGLNMESMTHGMRWLLIDIGRRLERAQRTIAFIRATLVAQQPEATQHLLLESVLKTTDNIITYRRRYRAYLQLPTVLDLLLLDEKNPRSLLYQLQQLQSHLERLPRAPQHYRLSSEEQILLRAYTRLRLADTVALAVADESGLCQKLDELLADLMTLLNQLSNVLTERYFIHAQPRHQFAVVQADLTPTSPEWSLEAEPRT
ncbi:MAG: circularly permuted type 2 ATP-grasp protein [Caldilineaceae bacterium]